MARIRVSRTLFPIQTLTGPVSTPEVNVPNNLDAVQLVVTANPGGFEDPAEEVEMTVECSLDGGVVWQNVLTCRFHGGARDREGNRPNVLVTLPAREGPQRQARASLAPLAGTPTLGIVGDAVNFGG